MDSIDLLFTVFPVKRLMPGRESKFMMFVQLVFFSRLEKVNIKSSRGKEKVIGTVICVGGAMIMTLYRGPKLQFFIVGYENPSNHVQI